MRRRRRAGHSGSRELGKSGERIQTVLVRPLALSSVGRGGRSPAMPRIESTVGDRRAVESVNQGVRSTAAVVPVRPIDFAFEMRPDLVSADAVLAGSTAPPLWRLSAVTSRRTGKSTRSSRRCDDGPLAHRSSLASWIVVRVGCMPRRWNVAPWLAVSVADSHPRVYRPTFSSSFFL